MAGNKIIKHETPLQLFKIKLFQILMNKTAYDGVDSKWQDLPMELLIRILMFVDDRTVIIASGVCTRWKEAIGFSVQELSLSWCKRNINNLVLSAVPKFTRLQFLNLHHCQSHLNDQAVEMVAKYCDDLRALDLSFNRSLTDKALEALAHGCNLLEKLYISGCIRVTDSALIFLSEKCNKLTHLSLYCCLSAATDRGLLALAQNCCGLQFLNLGWCESVTDVGVTGLAKWCPELRVVDLCACVCITDRCLLALARNCCGLQILNLCMCYKATDVGVTGLAKWCPKLRVVGLCGCVLITDQSVIALAENCRYLRSLALPCNITDTAMYALVNSSVRRAVKPNIKGKGNNSRYNSEPLSKSCMAYGSLSRSNGSCSICSYRNRFSAASDEYMEPVFNDQDNGLELLNISECTSLSVLAVQAVCDTFPALHNCPKRQSLIINGFFKRPSVHCKCPIESPGEEKNRVAFSDAELFDARFIL